MAYEENVTYTSTLRSTADLSAAANQFRAVKLGAAGLFALAAAGTDRIIGILASKPKAGEPALIAQLSPGSVLKVKLGASQTIAIGDKLVPDSAGDLVEGTTSDLCSLIAQEAATTGAGASQIISARVVAEFVI